MQRIRSSASRLVGLSLLLAGLAVSTGCGTSEEPPNVVLVTIDTLRADRLGAYGYDRALTPHLDRLAARGVVFEHAVSPTGTTWPTHASMLTGVYPRYHGLRRNGLELRDEVPVVTELLRDAGFATGAFVSYRAMHYRGRLDRGFEVASDREPRGESEPPIRRGEETVALAAEWLRDHAAAVEPIFLWLHLFEPHGPYELTDYSRRWLTESAYDGFLADGASMAELQRRKLEIVGSPAHVEAMNVLYDGEIALADELVGRLLTVLDAVGELKNTIVIVTSDHGQGLGENGYMGHGPTLREDVLHVPLIVRDFRSRRRGRRVARTVSILDLAPTIAEAALGLPMPDVQGRSLLPDLSATPRAPELREVFAEVKLSRDLAAAPSWYDPDATALYLDGLKLKSQHGELTAWDPGGPPSTETEFMGSLLDASFLSYGRAVTEEFLADEMQPEEVVLTNAEIEALRSLGYVQ